MHFRFSVSAALLPLSKWISNHCARSRTQRRWACSLSRSSARAGSAAISFPLRECSSTSPARESPSSDSVHTRERGPVSLVVSNRLFRSSLISPENDSRDRSDRWNRTRLCDSARRERIQRLSRFENRFETGRNLHRNQSVASRTQPVDTNPDGYGMTEAKYPKIQTICHSIDFASASTADYAKLGAAMAPLDVGVLSQSASPQLAHAGADTTLPQSIMSEKVTTNRCSSKICPIKTLPTS